MMEYNNFVQQYQTERLHLYQMDCMELLRQTPDKYYSLAIVDPPYGLPKDSTHGRGKLKNRAINAMDMSWELRQSQNIFKSYSV